MKKSKSYLGFIILSCFILGLGIFLLLINMNKSVVLSIEPPNLQVETQTPRLNQLDLTKMSPDPVVLSQISPDASHTISLKKVGQTEEISVNDQVIVERPAVVGLELLIPFNTWDPNDKYFFLNANTDTQKEYLVMKNTGEDFPNESPYIYLAELFAQAHPESSIVDVTGWAAPNLLIVNAKSSTEDKMTFWFEVPSQKFIRLSNYFY